MSEPGHNSGVAAGQLRAMVERIERLEDEKAEVAEQIREVYSESKAQGFDAKTIRKVVALRKKPAEERQEEEALLDLYMSALGMLPPQEPYETTPLAKAIRNLGEPTELTEEEKARGDVAAFIGKDGTRMSIGVGKGGAS